MNTGGIAALIGTAHAAEPVAWRLPHRGIDRLDFTRHEAAALLGLSYDQIRGLIDNDRLATVRRGRRIPLAALIGFLGITGGDAILADYHGEPRLALTAREAAALLDMHPTLLRRALGKSGQRTGWTGHAHVIPISTVIAFVRPASETANTANAA